MSVKYRFGKLADKLEILLPSATESGPIVAVTGGGGAATVSHLGDAEGGSEAASASASASS